MVEEGKEGERRKENRKGRVGEWEKGRVGERKAREARPASTQHPAPSTKYQAPSTQVNYTIQCPPSSLPEDGSQHITPSGKRASGDERSPGSSL